MADGSIIYEVRVDSTNAEADLARAGALLERGSGNIKALAQNTAQSFGKMLGDIFGTSTVHAENSVTRLGTAFNNLKNTAAPLLNAIKPVSRELIKIANISLPDLGVLTGKASSVLSSAAGKAPRTVKNNDIPSFATGTDYIPYDDFPALLHKGEAVLTASENAALKAAGGINSLAAAQPIIIKNDAESGAAGELGRRPVEVSLKIGDYEFTQIIAETMNNLYRQWGTNPLK